VRAGCLLAAALAARGGVARAGCAAWAVFWAGMRDSAGFGGGAGMGWGASAIGPLGVIDLPQLLQNFAPTRSGFPQCGQAFQSPPSTAAPAACAVGAGCSTDGESGGEAGF
jgi:hypothetical protein